MNCPNYGSYKTKRSGTRVCAVYLVLITAAIVAVLAFELNAAIVGGITSPRHRGKPRLQPAGVPRLWHQWTPKGRD
jgi:hypothetical protein